MLTDTSHSLAVFRLTIFALVTGFFLITAGGSGDSKPLYQDDYAIKTTFEQLIKKQHRDPNSYEFVSLRPNGDESKDGRYFIIEYRAKNGFGGYTMGKAGVFCDSTKMTLIANVNE